MPVPASLAEPWQIWRNNLPTDMTVPRTLLCHQDPIQSRALHAFGDTSSNGVSVALFCSAAQTDRNQQVLVTAVTTSQTKCAYIPAITCITPNGPQSPKQHQEHTSRVPCHRATLLAKTVMQLCTGSEARASASSS